MDRRTVRFLVTALLVTVGGASALEWTPIVPPRRCAAKAAVDSANQRAILFGGTTVYDDGAYLDDVWELTFNNVRRYAWHRLTPSGTTPSGRADHVMVYDPAGQRMLVFGGSPQRYVHVNDVWALGLARGSEVWQQLQPTGGPPGGRGYAFGIYHPGRRSLVVFGGYSGSNLYNDVWELRLDSMYWRQVTPAGTQPSARYDGASVYDAANDRMLVFGGRTSSTFVNEMWALDLTPGNERWTQLSQAGSVPSGRAGFAWAASPAGAELLVCAGWGSGGYRNDLYRFDVPTLTWTALHPSGGLLPERRNTTGFADWASGGFFVTGGEGEFGYLADTYYADCSLVGEAEWTGPLGDRPGLVLEVESVASGDVRFGCLVNRPCDLEVSIVDAAGRTMCNVFSGHVAPPGRWFSWDGHDQSGDSASSGTYYCRVESGNSVVAEKFALVR